VRQYCALDSAIQGALADMTDITGVLFCGHSLGGALACVATSMWTSSVSCQLVTFGAPRPGNAAFCAVVRAKTDGIVTRVVHDLDLVPTTPMRAMQYQHATPAWLMVDHSGTVTAESAERSVCEELLLRAWGVLAADFGVSDHFMSRYMRAVPVDHRSSSADAEKSDVSTQAPAEKSDASTQTTDETGAADGASDDGDGGVNAEGADDDDNGGRGDTEDADNVGDGSEPPPTKEGGGDGGQTSEPQDDTGAAPQDDEPAKADTADESTNEPTNDTNDTKTDGDNKQEDHNDDAEGPADSPDTAPRARSVRKAGPAKRTVKKP
jgi:hypothetical protein